MKDQSTYFKILLSALMVAGFVLSGCGPDDKPTTFLSQETKDYCLFHKGSYWVYESEFGEIDSMFLFLREEGLNDLDNRFSEGFGLSYSSSHYTEDKLRQGMEPFGSTEKNASGGGAVGEYWDKHYLSSWTVFYDIHRDSNGFRYKQPYETIEYAGLKDSLNIKDSTYYSVREYRTIASSSQFAIKHVWWAKHVGKVKYVDRDDVTWSLIRYKVYQ